MKRLKTGFAAFDKILGGGLVPGSTSLLSGPPGVGKTTLALQIAATCKSVYASGEQSEADLTTFARRVLGKMPARMSLLNNEQGINVYGVNSSKKPAIIVIDSIQTAYVEDLDSVGSRSQINAVANWLTSFARMTKTAVVIISHENKNGDVPVVVEHLADTVCRIEKYDVDLREITLYKNRNGACGSVQIKMTGVGFVSV